MKAAPQAATVLKKAWIRLRKKDHRNWSLREVAKEAKISPGYLSKIFSRQMPLSLKVAKKLVTVLKVDGVHQEIIFNSFPGTSPRSKFKANTPQPLMEAFELPPEDSEWLLGKWYTLPLLDLMTIQKFSRGSKIPAGRLGLSNDEVQEALDKLISAGLAALDADGHYFKVHEKIRFPTVISKKIIREHHKSQMRRAMNELDQKILPKDFNKRLIVGLSVATDPKKLEQVKNFLHMALYQAAEMLSEGEGAEVYQLNLQLFPQTK